MKQRFLRVPLCPSWLAAKSLNHQGHEVSRRRCQLLLKNSAPSGGSFRTSEYGRPCSETSSPFMPPAFPMPLPAYSLASLFSNSRQNPPNGTPMRYGSRGTGVKLQTTRIVSSGRLPLRSNDTTLAAVSLQSTHSNP